LFYVVIILFLLLLTGHHMPLQGLHRGVSGPQSNTRFLAPAASLPKTASVQPFLHN